MQYYSYSRFAFTIPDENKEYKLQGIDGILYNKKLDYGAGWIFPKKREIEIVNVIKQELKLNITKRESKLSPKQDLNVSASVSVSTSSSVIPNVLTTPAGASSDMTLKAFIEKYPNLKIDFDKLSDKDKIDLIKKLI